MRSTVGAGFSDYIHDGSGTTVGALGANAALIRQEFGGLATYTSTGAYFHHRDWLGNLRIVTDQAGAIQQTCTNLPFGDALNCSAAGETPTYSPATCAMEKPTSTPPKLATSAANSVGS